ncbi:hypothetical protein SNEBB_001772 [Seison nebaliae]|nr:hypothetical protein SNEBB_001772 [Seison nebaliae]
MNYSEVPNLLSDCTKLIRQSISDRSNQNRNSTNEIDEHDTFIKSELPSVTDVEEDRLLKEMNRTELNDVDNERLIDRKLMENQSGSISIHSHIMNDASSTNSQMCRICHLTSDEWHEMLISPCLCKGTLKVVHPTCLEKWIKNARSSRCELCHHQFMMKTKIKPIIEWKKLEMDGMEQRKLICSVLFYFIAICCVIWAVYILINKSTQDIKNGHLHWVFWTRLLVLAIGCMGFVLFIWSQCRMYVQLCFRWRQSNRLFFIQPLSFNNNIITNNNSNNNSNNNNQECEGNQIESFSNDELNEQVQTSKPETMNTVIPQSNQNNKTNLISYNNRRNSQISQSLSLDSTGQNHENISQTFYNNYSPTTTWYQSLLKNIHILPNHRQSSINSRVDPPFSNFHIVYRN